MWQRWRVLCCMCFATMTSRGRKRGGKEQPAGRLSRVSPGKGPAEAWVQWAEGQGGGWVWRRLCLRVERGGQEPGRSREATLPGWSWGEGIDPLGIRVRSGGVQGVVCPGWRPGGPECQAVEGLRLSRRSPGVAVWPQDRAPGTGAGQDGLWGLGEPAGTGGRGRDSEATAGPSPEQPPQPKVPAGGAPVGQRAGGRGGARSPQLCHPRTPAVSPPRGSCAVSAPAGPWARFAGWTSVPGHLAPHCPSGSATDPVPLSASASTTLHGAPAPVLWAGSGSGCAARCPPPEAVRSPRRVPSPSALPAPTRADHAGGRARSRAEAACPA